MKYLETIRLLFLLTLASLPLFSAVGGLSSKSRRTKVSSSKSYRNQTITANNDDILLDTLTFLPLEAFPKLLSKINLSADEAKKLGYIVDAFTYGKPHDFRREAKQLGSAFHQFSSSVHPMLALFHKFNVLQNLAALGNFNLCQVIYNPAKPVPWLTPFLPKPQDIGCPWPPPPIPPPRPTLPPPNPPGGGGSREYEYYRDTPWHPPYAYPYPASIWYGQGWDKFG